MKDQILAGYLKDFVTDFDLGEESEAVAFEHFVNFCAISPLSHDRVDPHDHRMGDGEFGIDGGAALIEGIPVFNQSQVAELRSRFRVFDATFVLTQAKTSSHFDAGDLGNFLHAVASLFSPAPIPSEQANLHKLRQIKDAIYDRTLDFNANPRLILVFATGGEWTNDPTLKHRVDVAVEQLRATKLFSDVRFLPLDVDGLKNTYREIKRKAVREIQFPSHTTLPELHGIRQSFIGIMRCSEFLKLITSSTGDMQRSIFYDNIRDYQGTTAVNTEIEQTVISKDVQPLLPVLNNGITIVASSVQQTGDTFRIHDYQIVNGCQTSHVLFNQRATLSANTVIPVKLIETTDSDVTARIIKATNRQNEVKPEAFASLAPFHKELEEYYAAKSKSSSSKLYYERRSKQYDYLPDVKPYQVVTLSRQLNAFMAMFLEEPQSTHRYYGELLKANSARLFNERHHLAPYHVSALTLYEIERCLHHRVLPGHLRPFRFHLALAFRLTWRRPPSLESKSVIEYCAEIEAVLQNPLQRESRLKRAAALIMNALGNFNNPEAERLKAFTNILIRQASNSHAAR